MSSWIADLRFKDEHFLSSRSSSVEIEFCPFLLSTLFLQGNNV